MKSSARRPLHMVLALACATATLGGCATDLSALSRTGALAKSTKTQQAATAGVLISGSVMAPAGVIAVGGGNLGGKGYVVLQSLEEKPLANAEVFLADAAGSPIPGLDPVKTDAKGKFSFQDVPKGFTFVVVARGQNQDGKEALLQTLARSGELGASAEVNAATTLLTSSVVESQGGSLGDFNPASFKSAVETAKKNLKAEDLPDFSDRAAVAARMKAIAERVGELKSQIDALKTELKDIKKGLDELKSQIANRKPIVGDRPEGVPFNCDEGFKKTDRNGDGKIDREEARVAFPDTTRFDEEFKRRDRNADGAIAPSEFCQPSGGQPPMPPQDDTMANNPDPNNPNPNSPDPNSPNPNNPDPNNPYPNNPDPNNPNPNNPDPNNPNPNNPDPNNPNPNNPNPNNPDPNNPNPNNPPAAECTVPITHSVGLSPALAGTMGFPVKLRAVVPNTDQIKGEGFLQTSDARVQFQINEGCPHDYIILTTDGKEVKRVRFTIPQGAPLEIKLPL